MDVVLWLREITITARRAIPAITVTTTRDDEPFADVVLFAEVAAGDVAGAAGAAGAAFAGGVVEIAATVRAGVAADAEMRLGAADFFATFFALFFTATVGLLDLAVGLAVGKEYFSDA